MNKEKIRNLIRWLRVHPDWCWDYENQIARPFLRAVGNDRNGLEEYLSSLPPEDLAERSGVFENISRKWKDEHTRMFLQSLQQKIAEAGLQP